MNNQGRSFFFETYGCQMNFAESNALALQLKGEGWMEAEDAESADLIILNTCAVRKTAEDRIIGRIGHYKHMKQDHPLSLLITGCMAERLKERLKKEHPAVDYVVGNFEKHTIGALLDGRKPKSDGEAGFHFEPLHLEEGAFKAFLPIMHGCNNFCSYCIVPYVRGREQSRDPRDIYREIERLEEAGVKELTLLGQNVNSYRWEDGGEQLDFPALLSEISTRCSSIRWIRFVSSHPKDVPDRLIELIAEEDKICNHFHLPVQSGSNSVLAEMGRKYSREDYLQLVSRMKEQIPGLSLSTDMMVGFPGESEEDFEDSLDLIRRVGYEDAFTYYYNPREGTRAAEMDNQIPQDLKLERLQRLIELQRSVSAAQREKRLDSSEMVLVEQCSKKKAGEMLGRTSRNEMVVFPGTVDQIGSFVQLRLSELYGNTFKGVPICPGK